MMTSQFYMLPLSEMFDTQIVTEEVAATIRHMKCRKASSPDGIHSEHLKYGGEMITQLLIRVLNCILDLETIPQTFKHSIIIPVHKGKGRDPLSCGSYCGISLVSTLAKVMELVILNRIKPILQEQGMPHQFQTAYHKKC